MTVYNGLIGLFWLIFILVWGVLAINTKPGTRGGGGFGWRIVAVIIIFWIFKSGIYRFVAPIDAAVEGNPTIHLIGVIFTGVGIAFAVWARLYLGKNWGMPQSVKENPELVTKGPYRFVRHPIYSGILLAMLGSVLASSIVWAVILIFAAYYFVTSAFKEEALMQKTFPDKYESYKKHSKMLVPGLY